MRTHPEKPLMQKIGEGVQKIFEHPSYDFAELLRSVDLDPRRCLRGMDIDLDLQENDVAGWDFSGCNLSGANFSKVRNIEKAIFSDRTVFNQTLLPKGMTVEMLHIVPHRRS